MRIRTGAFGQLYSMDFHYSITLSSGFDWSWSVVVLFFFSKKNPPAMHFNFEFSSLFTKLNCGFWVHVVFFFFREGGLSVWCGCCDVSHHVCTAQNWNVLNACRMLCGIPISLSAWRWMFPLTAESEFTLWCSGLLSRAAPRFSPSLHKHALNSLTQ